MTDKQIILKYPRVFGIPPFDPKKTSMVFGFDCGKGWYPLLKELADELDIIIQEDNLKDFITVQVKEKFGTLRFYTHNGNERTESKISNACKISSETCEVCGKPGTLRIGGWLQTRCDDCN